MTHQVRDGRNVRIESVQNSRVKIARRLYNRKYRRQSGLTIIEGERLLQEAINRDIEFVDAFCCPEMMSNALRESNLLRQLEHKLARPAAIVSPSLMRQLADTDEPQGVVAVIRWPRTEPTDWQTALQTKKRMLLLDRVQDPVNAGTLLRTAVAFAVDAVFCLPGTTDFMAPKVIRGSMGAIFRLPVYRDVDYEQLLQLSMTGRIERIGTSVQGGVAPRLVSWQEPWILAIGNEASGLSPQITSDCTQLVTIPMPGGMESLNVSIATAILLYESQRT